MRSKLREARAKRKFTQQQIAVRLGVSQQTVSKHEKGVTTPAHFNVIREYERLLGVRAEDVFPDIFN